MYLYFVERYIKAMSIRKISKFDVHKDDGCISNVCNLEHFVIKNVKSEHESQTKTRMCKLLGDIKIMVLIRCY